MHHPLARVPTLLLGLAFGLAFGLALGPVSVSSSTGCCSDEEHESVFETVLRFDFSEARYVARLGPGLQAIRFGPFGARPLTAIELELRLRNRPGPTNRARPCSNRMSQVSLHMATQLALLVR